MTCHTCPDNALQRPFPPGFPAVRAQLARVLAALGYSLTAAARLHRYRELGTRSLENLLAEHDADGRAHD